MNPEGSMRRRATAWCCARSWWGRCRAGHGWGSSARSAGPRPTSATWAGAIGALTGGVALVPAETVAAEDCPPGPVGVDSPLAGHRAGRAAAGWAAAAAAVGRAAVAGRAAAGWAAAAGWTDAA